MSRQETIGLLRELQIVVPGEHAVTYRNYGQFVVSCERNPNNLKMDKVYSLLELVEESRRTPSKSRGKNRRSPAKKRP